MFSNIYFSIVQIIFVKYQNLTMVQYLYVAKINITHYLPSYEK